MSSSSKRGVLMGTDMDGMEDMSSGGGGRTIMPSAHVLAALEGSNSSSNTSQTRSSKQVTSSTSMGTDMHGFGDDDAQHFIEASTLLPACVPAAASTHPSRPRDLFDASLSPVPASVSTAAGAPVRPGTGRVDSSLAARMAELNATFASMRGGDSAAATSTTTTSSTTPDVSSAALLMAQELDMPSSSASDLASLMMLSKNTRSKSEEDAKQPLGAPSHPPTSNDSSIATASTASAAPAAAAAPMSTCFDVVTSTACRIRLSRIIAASSVGDASSSSSSSSTQSLTRTIDALRSTAGGMGRSSGAASDSFVYVALEPVDWSRHHADSIFARVTANNSSADQLDEIVLDMAQERDRALQLVQQKDQTIEQLKRQVQELQQQLQQAQQQKSSGNTSAASRPAAATSSASSSNQPLAPGHRTKSVYSDDSADEQDQPAEPASSDSEEEEEEEEEDEDEGDMEDMMAETRPHTTTTSTSTTGS